MWTDQALRRYPEEQVGLRLGDQTCALKETRTSALLLTPAAGAGEKGRSMSVQRRPDRGPESVRAMVNNEVFQWLDRSLFVDWLWQKARVTATLL